jgi:hypothetical protein
MASTRVEGRATDPSFKNAGTKLGLEIWRVEKLAVVKKPPTDPCYQGNLFEGDSYIVLHTKPDGTAIRHDIFFWIGKDSSQDEYGVAAYKTVELDDHINDTVGVDPVQHRETQGHETAEFRALFKQAGGIKYHEGGIATGFKKVDRDAFETRLLHIKGKRNPRVTPVAINASSVTCDDVFILDKGRTIYQFNGKEASKHEKAKGLEMTRQIRDQERSGKAKIIVCEQGGENENEFWKAMDVPKPGRIKSSGVDDAAHDRKIVENTRLYHVSDASGKLVVNDITPENREFHKDMLDTNDSYILDAGGQHIFAWIGKKASDSERKNAMKIATDFIAQKGYPKWTPVTRVAENGETPLFKSNFKVWPMPKPKAGTRKRPSVAKFDVKTMHSQKEREQVRCVDDGSGKLEIWRVENFELEPVPKKEYGQFYAGDSYVLLYTYLVNNKENYIIYFWQGLQSSQDEKGASAIHAKDLDDKYGGAPVQVRVVQNKEPPHFHLLFKGKMVVHSGGHASGWKNKNDTDSYDTDGTRLFQVRGTNEYDTRALQVPEKAASLNSGDVFILETPKNLFLWYGKGCSGDERQMAQNILPSIKAGGYESFMEGQEPQEFWDALGGKAPYANSKAVLEDESRDPRLFQVTTAQTGSLYVEEIFEFDQEDLIEDDVMILDTHYEIFIWVGKGASPAEKKGSLETALKYIESDPSGRKKEDVCILQIKQGFEPPNFTGHFIGWDPEKWSKGKSYEELKAELQATNPAGGSAAADIGPVDISDAMAVYSATHSYETLIGSEVPEGVDPTKKEQYLSDAEFQEVFKMSKVEFNALPQWKQNNHKKKVKLY